MRAIARCWVAVAIVAPVGCAGASAPPSHAPIEVVDVPHAEALDSSAPVVDNAPIEDAGAVAEAETKTETTELVIGDKSHHEKLRLPIRGFYRVHVAPIVTVTQKGVTHDAQVTPPFMNSYFLDGVHQHSVPDGCINYCESVAKRGVTVVDLVDYVEDGVHPGPGPTEGAIPVYRTIDLKGSIAITFDYFADSKCTVKKVFKTRIKR